MNRASNDVVRTSFTPEEVCSLTMEFYRRNYIEGLFLSSGVKGSPDHTMEELCRTVQLLRTKYHFHGYIHLKAIPGASPDLIRQAGYLADRMSVNLELPTADGLRRLAPHKSRQTILRPMRQIQLQRDASKEELILFKHAPQFVPAGQSTQMIIGASGENDYQILRVPGIGDRSARRIVGARKTHSLDFTDLQKIGVVLKRALYFITCNGRMMYRTKLEEDYIIRNITDARRPEQLLYSTCRQLSFFDREEDGIERRYAL